MPLSASRAVIAAMKPTASSEEWISSVIMRQGKIAGQPGLARCLLGDDQRRALALPKHHLRLDTGGNAVRHGDEDEHAGRQVRPHRAEQH